MGGIFISYRREDSAGWTGRLSEHLRERFGPKSIFIDIDTIQPGADFTEALQTAVSSCDVLLAIIGPKWATATDKSGKPRLEDPTDWVRTARQVAPGGPSDTPDLSRYGADGSEHRATQTCRDRGARGCDRNNRVDALKPGAPSSPLRDDVPHAAPQGTPEVAPPQTPETKPELDKPKPAVALQIIHLRAGQEARLKSQFLGHVYTILAAEIRPQYSSTALLGLKVCLTNNGSGGANFWSDTFRLLANGVPRAPSVFSMTS